jgi:hypothetical protein
MGTLEEQTRAYEAAVVYIENLRNSEGENRILILNPPAFILMWNIL